MESKNLYRILQLLGQELQNMLKNIRKRYAKKPKQKKKQEKRSQSIIKFRNIILKKNMIIKKDSFMHITPVHVFQAELKAKEKRRLKAQKSIESVSKLSQRNQRHQSPLSYSSFLIITWNFKPRKAFTDYTVHLSVSMYVCVYILVLRALVTNLVILYSRRQIGQYIIVDQVILLIRW